MEFERAEALDDEYVMFGLSAMGGLIDLCINAMEITMRLDPQDQALLSEWAPDELNPLIDGLPEGVDVKVLPSDGLLRCFLGVRFRIDNGLLYPIPTVVRAMTIGDEALRKLRRAISTPA